MDLFDVGEVRDCISTSGRAEGPGEIFERLKRLAKRQLGNVVDNVEQGNARTRVIACLEKRLSALPY